MQSTLVVSYSSNWNNVWGVKRKYNLKVWAPSFTFAIYGYDGINNKHKCKYVSAFYENFDILIPPPPPRPQQRTQHRYQKVPKYYIDEWIAIKYKVKFTYELYWGRSRNGFIASYGTISRFMWEPSFISLLEVLGHKSPAITALYSHNPLFSWLVLSLTHITILVQYTTTY